MKAIVRSRLREFMEAKSKEYGFKITQSQLGNAVGLPQPTISTWMSDRPIHQINPSVVGKLAMYFDVDPSELLQWEYIEDKDEEKISPSHYEPTAFAYVR